MFPTDAIWDGQSRMIPCQGGCGWKQSQSDSIHHRCTDHPTSADAYAGRPCPGESSHQELL